MAGLAQRIHFDPIGGIAGEMFVAALADTFPDLIPGLLAEMKKLPAPARADIRFIVHRDAVLGGLCSADIRDAVVSKNSVGNLTLLHGSNS